MTAQNTKGAPRSKRVGANDSPARKRYVAGGMGATRCALKKIRNLVRCCGLSPQEAFALWDRTRKRRRGNLQMSYVEKGLPKEAM